MHKIHNNALKNMYNLSVISAASTYSMRRIVPSDRNYKYPKTHTNFVCYKILRRGIQSKKLHKTHPKRRY